MSLKFDYRNTKKTRQGWFSMITCLMSKSPQKSVLPAERLPVGSSCRNSSHELIYSDSKPALRFLLMGLLIRLAELEPTMTAGSECSKLSPSGRKSIAGVGLRAVNLVCWFTRLRPLVLALLPTPLTSTRLILACCAGCVGLKKKPRLKLV